MPTCAIYARVSDEAQLKGDSIEHQIAFCQEIANRRGEERHERWETPDACVYVDEGISGTSLVKRLAAQRLIQDSRQGKFDIVLFKGISRFARDTVDALIMLRSLLASGVRVISIEENYDSERDNAEFAFTIHSALAQAESEKTSVRVRMGARQKAKQGKWNGQPPDGYVLNAQTKRLEVDPSYAPIVREIFDLYLSGKGCRRITSMLNERGIRTKKGFLWTQRAVSRILSNPAYAGDIAYGRRQKRPAPMSEEDLLVRRKVTVWVRDTDQVIVCRDAHPAIVDRSTYEQAAAIMAGRRKEPGRSGELHLLTRGLLRCRCGSSMVIKYNHRKVRYYRCLAQAERGRTYCEQPYLRADDVEEMILQRVRGDAEPILGFEHLPLTPVAETTRAKDELGDVDRQMEKLMKSSVMLFEQYAEGILSREQFAHLNESYRYQIDRLQHLKCKLAEHQGLPRERKEVRELLQEAMSELLSERTGDVMVTRRILERLVHHVSVDGCELRIVYRFGRGS